MANLENIQYAAAKTGLNILGRIVRGVDLYYYDFIAGGNNFVATDSANTRITMPARSAPQNYIYESATFDIEPWDDGWYEWQVYDTAGKLLAISRYYIFSGSLMFDDYLAGLKTDVAGVAAKTDNLPAIPASEPNATANKNSIVSEIDDNEIKIDSVQSDTTAIKAKTDNLPALPASEPNATANKNEIISEIDSNEAKLDSIKSDTIAIEAKTDNLPVDPASQSQVEAAITISEALIRTDISAVPAEVWEIDINDTEQPTIIQKAKHWLGLSGSIKRKQ